MLKQSDENSTNLWIVVVVWLTVSWTKWSVIFLPKAGVGMGLQLPGPPGMSGLFRGVKLFLR